MTKKSIALYPFNEKRHSLYDSTVELLSKKFEVHYTFPTTKAKQGYISKLKNNKDLRIFYHKYVRNLVSLNDFKTIFSSSGEKNKLLPYDLIYSCNSIPNLSNNYIIDLELISALAGYNFSKLNRDQIKESFESPSCKYISCWNEFSKESLLKVIDCSNFKHKIKVLHFAMKSDKVVKKKHSGMRLLFISSINNPQDFELKGGIVALEAYSRLLNYYDNISLVVRSYLSESVKKKYGGLRGLRFIEESIEKEELEKLFLGSDLLFQPMPGINLMLECMNFKLPIIGFDFGAIAEMIVDNKTGLHVDSSPIFGRKDRVEEFHRNLHLNYLKLFNETVDEEILKSYVNKTRFVLDNPKILDKMSRETKRLVEKGGKYNLEKRNKQLLEMIEKSF